MHRDGREGKTVFAQKSAVDRGAGHCPVRSERWFVCFSFIFYYSFLFIGRITKVEGRYGRTGKQVGFGVHGVKFPKNQEKIMLKGGRNKGKN